MEENQQNQPGTGDVAQNPQVDSSPGSLPETPVAAGNPPTPTRPADAAMPMDAAQKKGDSRWMLWLGLILIIIIVLVVVLLLPSLQNTTTTNTDQQTTPTATDTVTPDDGDDLESTTTPTTSTGPVSEEDAGNAASTVMLFYTDPNGETIGDEIGCGDTTAGVPEELGSASDTPIQTALERLFALDQVEYFEPPVRNALYQSNVTVDSVMLDGTTATVALSGNLLSAGECDDPRIKAQIEYTVTQFEWVDSAEVTINGESLADYFDLRG
ncbi:MAG: GerMN domain-containing protein [Candidatus Dojkabacteria bacterium]